MTDSVLHPHQQLEKIMDFPTLTQLPGYTWLPGAMSRERDAIDAEIGEILALRGEIRGMEPQVRTAFQADHQSDRRDFFRKIIACFEREAAIRPRIDIWQRAVARSRDVARQEAQAALEDIVARTREHLGLAPEDILPPPSLQCNPLWHEARKRLDAVPSGIDTGDAIRANHVDLIHCNDRLAHFKQQLAHNEHVLRQREKDRQADEERQRAQEAKCTSRVDGMAAAISVLLQPDPPVIRKRQTVHA